MTEENSALINSKFDTESDIGKTKKKATQYCWKHQLKLNKAEHTESVSKTFAKKKNRERASPKPFALHRPPAA